MQLEEQSSKAPLVVSTEEGIFLGSVWPLLMQTTIWRSPSLPLATEVAMDGHTHRLGTCIRHPELSGVNLARSRENIRVCKTALKPILLFNRTKRSSEMQLVLRTYLRKQNSPSSSTGTETMWDKTMNCSYLWMRTSIWRTERKHEEELSSKRK